MAACSTCYRASRWSVVVLVTIGWCSARSAICGEGSSTSDPQPAAAYFRVKQVDGRWWFLSPGKEPLLSIGVCHVTFQGDSIRNTGVSPYREAVQKKYRTVENWRKATAVRLVSWGFNTLGAWSDEKLSRAGGPESPLACAPTVDLGARFVEEAGGGGAWLRGLFPDAFDPAFETSCRRTAERRCGPRKEDPAVLGWFSDNELRWGPDWRTREELITSFLNLPSGAPGRAAAAEVLRQRYGQVQKFNEVWKTAFGTWDDLKKTDKKIAAPYARKEVYAQREEDEAKANRADPRRAAFAADCEAFVGALAQRYFRVTREAILGADPHHLVFGCRFAYPPPKPVLAAAAKYLDVVSFNCYATDPTAVIERYAPAGKPVIIGEFTFRARDSGLPNTRGAGPTIQTQQERAAGFEHYARTALRRPEVVGYHWFQYTDQPKEGRFDGENSNYGLVNVEDEPYALLTETMLRVNRLAGKLHAAGK